MKAFVLGELCEDILMHSPASTEVMGQKIWAKDIILTAGGSTYYTGAALRALGAEVEVCSVVGEDESGQRVIRMLRSIQMGCSQVQSLAGKKTTKSIIVCDGGEKTFIGCSPMLPLQLPQWEQLKDAALFYIAGYTLYPELWTESMLSLCRMANDHHICVAMDSQMLPIPGKNLAEVSGLRHILPAVNVFFTARKEAMRLFGTDDENCCRAIMREMGFTGQLILKSGSKGCQVMDSTTSTFVPAVPVKAYDTVGSGDVFGASYCWGWCQGWDMVKSAQFAAAYTALSIGEYDEKKRFPSAAEAEDLLLQNL